MDTKPSQIRPPLPRAPWNKGKIIGSKPPQRTKHVWSIRTKLQVDGRLRDLAMFNVAIDSKLRAVMLEALRTRISRRTGRRSTARP